MITHEPYPLPRVVGNKRKGTSSPVVDILPSKSTHSVISLQKIVGNQGVQALLRSGKAGSTVPNSESVREGRERQLSHVVKEKKFLRNEPSQVVQANPISLQSTRSNIFRTAASCPSNWSSTVGDDHDRALRMIDRARTKLSAYDGTSPADVKTALTTHFKASSSGFAGWVNFNLGFLRLVAQVAGYDCEDTGSWWCGSRTLAKTLWCVPGFDIRVCQPLYFGQTAKERSETLIHEWVHKYGCNFDLGYSHSSDYPQQWTITALVNADPWSEFVKDVQ